jgi:hypothetical protein
MSTRPRSSTPQGKDSIDKTTTVDIDNVEKVDDKRLVRFNILVKDTALRINLNTVECGEELLENLFQSSRPYLLAEET